jgi:hypothetical protein
MPFVCSEILASRRSGPATARALQYRFAMRRGSLRSIIQAIICMIVALCCCTALSAQQPAAGAQARAAAATPAQPLLSHVNKELPGWLRFSGEYRIRVEGVQGAGFQPDRSDAYALGRLRLNMRVSPFSWLRFQFQGQDAQAFWRNAKPDASPFEDTMDLRQAYAEFGRAENPPLVLRVGRQELVFGEMRLLGHLNWTNTARAFDAARLTVQQGSLKVDVFSASVVNFREGRFNKSAGGNGLHGAYGSLSKLAPNATVEPYVLWRFARGTRSEDGAPGLTDRKVFGARWAGKLPAGFDYGVEMAGQKGSVGSDSISALAGHWVVGYTLGQLKQKPRFVAEYNYASGDSAPGDGAQETFDQLYPTGHDKLGLADQVGWKNIHDLRSGVEFKPAGKWTVAAFYHSWWLASPRDALYNAAGAQVARVADGSAGRHVGHEASVQMIYTLNATTSIGAGFANVFPGTFLKRATPGEQYRQPYIMLTHSF